MTSGDRWDAALRAVDRARRARAVATAAPVGRPGPNRAVDAADRRAETAGSTPAGTASGSAGTASGSAGTASGSAGAASSSVGTNGEVASLL